VIYFLPSKYPQAIHLDNNIDYLLAKKTSALRAGGKPFGKTQGEHKTPAAISEFKQYK